MPVQGKKGLRSFLLHSALFFVQHWSLTDCLAMIYLFIFFLLWRYFFVGLFFFLCFVWCFVFFVCSFKLWDSCSA